MLLKTLNRNRQKLDGFSPNNLRTNSFTVKVKGLEYVQGVGFQYEEWIIMSRNLLCAGGVD